MSLSVGEAIKEVALEGNGKLFSFPPIVLKSIEVIQGSNFFLYYRVYKIMTYFHPKDSLIVGGLLCSSARFIGIAAYLKTAIYIKCTLDLIAKYASLYESCQELTHAVTYEYPLIQEDRLSFLHPVFSPSFVVYFEATVLKIYLRFLKIIKAFAKVVFQIFEISFYLRDLYLLTKEDQMAEFYAYSSLANEIDQHFQDFQKNLKLIQIQLLSEESLGNRLIKKMGIQQNTIANLLAKFSKAHPTFLNQIDQEFKNGQENLRVFFETGNIELSVDKPILPECRFVPYLGLSERTLKKNETGLFKIFFNRIFN